MGLPPVLPDHARHLRRPLMAAALMIALAAPGAARAAEEEALDPRWSVFLITVDAMRPANMSLYGYERDTTPYLTDFAKDAMVFEKAFTTTAWTSPGIVSLLTGYYPPVHGQNSRYSFYDAEMASALRVLVEEGYDVYGSYRSGPTMSNLGFQDGVDANPRKGHDSLESFADRRRPENGPFFVWVHIKDTHLPYAPSEANANRWIDTSRESIGVEAVRRGHFVMHPDFPEAARRNAVEGTMAFTDEDTPVVRALYDGVVADADERLGRVIHRLRQSGVLDRTVVIISADHGEELLEHGWVGHASTSYLPKLYDEVTHIPLIIRLPDGSRAGRYDALVQNVDVVPTVLDVLGIDQARVSPAMQGHSLLPLVDGEAEKVRDYVFAETTHKGWTTPKDEVHSRLVAVRSQTRKLIRIPEGDGYRFEGYDLRDDPGEQRDIYEARKADFAELEQALADWAEDNRQRAASLVQEAGERRNAKLAEALAQGDLLEAARTWEAIEVMHRTWGLEPEPFYDHEPYGSAWTALRREAAETMAAAMACAAKGGRLEAVVGDGGGWTCAE
ncbi:MAG: sulfatase [Kiloniellales bacterium]